MRVGHRQCLSVPLEPRRLKPAETARVTVWLLALTGAMVIALLSLWPLAEQVQLAAQKTTASTTPTPEPSQLDLVIAHPRLTPGLSIIVIGMSSGSWEASFTHSRG